MAGVLCSDCLVEEFIEDPGRLGEIEAFDLLFASGDEDVVVEDIADGVVFGSYCCQDRWTWVLGIVSFLLFCIGC